MLLIAVQIIHICASLLMILFILLQTGKGADLGAMLGGGGSNTLFGATGATTFLSKLTTYAAVVFVLSCLVLAYMSAHPTTALDTGSTIMNEMPAVGGDTEPADIPEPVVEDTDAAAAPAGSDEDAPGPAVEEKVGGDAVANPTAGGDAEKTE